MPHRHHSGAYNLFWLILITGSELQDKIHRRVTELLRCFVHRFFGSRIRIQVMYRLSYYYTVLYGILVTIALNSGYGCFFKARFALILASAL